MNIIIKTLAELTPEEYRACHYLNMRGNGMMMYSLSDNKGSPKSKAVMIWNDTGDKLLGWAIMVPHEDEYGIYVTRYQKRRTKYVTQFYVRASERRKGYGRMLMEEVRKIEKTPLVVPHDRTSGDFFAEFSVVTDRYRRGIITSAKKRKKRRAA